MPTHDAFCRRPMAPSTCRGTSWINDCLQLAAFRHIVCAIGDSQKREHVYSMFIVAYCWHVMSVTKGKYFSDIFHSFAWFVLTSVWLDQLGCNFMLVFDCLLLPQTSLRSTFNYLQATFCFAAHVWCFVTVFIIQVLYTLDCYLMKSPKLWLLHVFISEFVQVVITTALITITVVRPWQLWWNWHNTPHGEEK